MMIYNNNSNFVLIVLVTKMCYSEKFAYMDAISNPLHKARGSRGRAHSPYFLPILPQYPLLKKKNSQYRGPRKMAMRRPMTLSAAVPDLAKHTIEAMNADRPSRPQMMAIVAIMATLPVIPDCFFSG